MQTNGRSNTKVIGERPSDSCKTRHCNAWWCCGMLDSPPFNSCLPSTTCRWTLGRKQRQSALPVTRGGKGVQNSRTGLGEKCSSFWIVGGAARSIDEGGRAGFLVHLLQSLWCGDHGIAHRDAQAEDSSRSSERLWLMRLRRIHRVGETSL